MQTDHKKVVVLYSPRDLWGIWDGIARYASLHSKWLLYPPLALPLTPKRTELLSWINRFKPDGLILPNARPELEQILELDIPIIIHRNLQELTHGWPTILGDSEAIGKMGAEHFLNLGFHNFAFFGYEESVPMQERAESFRKRIAKSRFKTSILMKPMPKSVTFWEEELVTLVDWIKLQPNPLAIMTGSDILGVYVLMACRMANLLVPQQVAILGVDNRRVICETQVPKLSSIELNHERAGFNAAELLDQLMNHQIEMAEQTIMIEPIQVVQRQSSDYLAIEDFEVAKAVEFIHKNPTKLLQIKDVAAQTNLSSNVLQKRFKKWLGCSILAEINRVRTDKIAEMLTTSKMSISEIAFAMGFSDVDHISRYFRKSKNMTPLSYRKKYSHQQI
jgi:LacI family transcriptional regulator